MESLSSLHRRGRHQHHAEYRPPADQPKPPRQARWRERGDRPAASERVARQVPGITLFMQPVQDLTIEDRVSRTQYQFTLEGADDDGAARRGRAQLVAAAAAAAAARRRRHRTCRTRGCRPTSTSTATRAGAPGHHARGDRQRALQRLRPAADLHHLHAGEPVPRGAGGEARVPQRPRGAERHLRARARGGVQVPLSAVATRERAADAARREPHRPVPGGHPLVQPRARAMRSARR